MSINQARRNQKARSRQRESTGKGPAVGEAECDLGREGGSRLGRFGAFSRVNRGRGSLEELKNGDDMFPFTYRKYHSGL